MSTNRYLGVDPILTNLSIGYRNEEYIAEKIWPNMDVKKQSGKHFIYDKGRFRINKTLRAAGAPANEVGLKFTTGLPYFCEDHALKQFVTDEDVDNAIVQGAPENDATENVTDMLLIDQEVALATTMADTGVLTQNTTLSGTSQWSDHNNSDPFANIETAKATIHESIFIQPNTLIMGKQVFDKLKHHPDLIERVKYSQLGVLTIDLMKTLFGVDNIIIGAAGKNTSTEGQSDTMGYIWGKHAWLAYINPRPAQKSITFGLTYRWKNRIVERLRGTNEEDRKGFYIRVGDHYYDQNIVSASAAYLIKNAVA
jgi:hypothetical protein